ncbi:hypothetical protein AVEN_247771-1 [Araneus ventricosus]|uniref:Chitin-binding type-2 domain-containing protein n=1 Tax=Araneus ventricosus TaxID=182803 RepID=A0A4Y2THR3_ARAVE|nr:hypothetical protein AVEN_247771-1 [Araneus ventricosus]
MITIIFLWDYGFETRLKSVMYAGLMILVSIRVIHPPANVTHRYSKEEEEDEEDDLQYVEGRRGRRRKKPVSRYTAFARKGIPGEDFPVFTYIPHTDFDCGPQPGLYADPYTDCQVWHMCPGGNLSPRHSFLCPNGTIFNQKKRICDWWYNVDCRKHTRKIRPND